MSRQLLERSLELAELTEWLSRVRGGQGDLVAIAGVAGIGKTELLGAAVEAGRREGMRVLTARGNDMESGFSFGVVRQLFELAVDETEGSARESLLAGAASQSLIALGDEMSDAPDLDRSFAVIHGLYWLTVNLCRSSPLLLAVDDVHWADEASVRWLLYLADRLEGLPIGVLLSSRTGEPGSDSEIAARLREVVERRALMPAPLTRAGVGAALEWQLGRPPGERLVEACEAVTGGNPFLVRELAAALAADRVESEQASVELVMELGPRSVARSVRLRIGRLGADADSLAQAVAILGDGASLRHAAALAGLSLEGAAEAAHLLADAGLFETGTPFRYVHALVRSAVYEDMPAPVRGVRHARAAALLVEQAADADQICAHLLRCEPAASAEVVQQLRFGAGRALTRGAPDVAASYLVRAIAEGAEGHLRVDLTRELAVCETRMRTPGAAEHFQLALDFATDPDERAAIAAELATVLWLAGRWDPALEVAESVLAELRSEPLPTSFSVSGPVARLEDAWAAMAAFDPVRVEMFDRYVAKVRASPGPSVLLSRTACVAAALVWRGEEPEEVSHLLGEILTEMGPLSEREGEHLLLMRVCAVALVADELAKLDAFIEGLTSLSRSRGSVFALVLALTYRTAVRARRGELAGAESDFRSVFELSQQHELSFAIAPVMWYGVDLLIERPELGDIAALAEVLQLPPDLDRTAIGAIFKEVRGRLALSKGNVAEARAQLSDAATTLDLMRLGDPNGSSYRSALAIALMGQDRNEALRLANEELDDARRLGCPRPIGVALRSLGVVEGGADGLEHLREAVEVLEGSYARLEQARSLVSLGSALRRSNQRAAARDPLRAGLDLAHHCGAHRLAAHAREELLATGARPRRATVAGVEALTAAERRVAELAGKGLSNPEIAQSLFVTINTIEGHLRHVYQKLSIGSRRQIVTALA